MTWNPRLELEEIWTAALAAVDPMNVAPKFLAPRPRGRLVVVGAGKASARMASAVEQHFGAPLVGLVLTRYGHSEPTQWLEVVEAGHPVPDEAGMVAATRILELAKSLGENDQLLMLLSGGASALLALPSEGVALTDKQTLNQALLACGAPIAEMNTVRKHLSRIKGGRLAAAAWPAETLTLAISDVPGDDPAVIGSGPTVADPTTLEDARSILARYEINPPDSIRLALTNPANESVKPNDNRLARSKYKLIAKPGDALAHARRRAESLGYRVMDLGDRVQGEAREVAKNHHRLAQMALQKNEATAIVSGGELTVTGAAGDRAGGRCREYALALASLLGRNRCVAVLAADTDGIDGTSDAAGGFVIPGDVERALDNGINPDQMLAQHHSGDYFKFLDRQLTTGPTRTNVGDLRVLLIQPENRSN